MSDKPVVIVGGGLSGLCCARRLVAHGIKVLVLESEQEVGGRVRTENCDGFQLDRGFQVLQTAYPEAMAALDYENLRLHPFEPGAMIFSQGKTAKMSDPWRRPGQVLQSAFNGIGTFADRWKLAKLRSHVLGKSIEELWQEPDSTTAEYLSNTCGFSSDIISRFFRPWFSGVFFEDELATSSRFFRFTFRMFADGDASLPESGMGAIPKQIAGQLPEGSICLNSSVESVGDRHVQLKDGSVIEAQAVVLAVEGPEASRLFNQSAQPPEFLATIGYYFAADTPPISAPTLVLFGDNTGPVNNLTVPSNVSSSYAPSGKSLISVSIVGKNALTWINQEDSPELEQLVKKQLRDWLGSQVDSWSMIKRYNIRLAIPKQPAHFRDNGPLESRLNAGLYRCGDYCETASINGAMASGRRTADAFLADAGILSNRADV